MNYNRSKGLSLVELMVALVLSLVIGAAVMQMFLSSKTTYRVQDAMSRLQENGRFAVGLIAAESRMAGYMGCGNLDEIGINVIASPPPLDATNPLGEIMGGADNVDSGNVWGATVGTDVLTIRKASNLGLQLTGNMAVDNANIQVLDNRLGLEAGDTLFIADCVSADIFRATSVSAAGGKTTVAHANNLNTSNRLSKAYGVDAEVMAFEQIDFFIRDTARLSSDGTPVRALWMQRRFANRSDTSANPAELVDGVEDFQVEYGIKTANSPVANEYRSADDVTDWSRVVSVRFRLLLSSTDDNVTAKAGDAVQSINFNGTAIAADGRLRQTFGSVVAVRNRVR
ncbi:MAG: PilW family protein [Pigmentiphaga sp.]